jgi:hypothetical protein
MEYPAGLGAPYTRQILVGDVDLPVSVVVETSLQ